MPAFYSAPDLQNFRTEFTAFGPLACGKPRGYLEPHNEMHR